MSLAGTGGGIDVQVLFFLFLDVVNDEVLYATQSLFAFVF